MAKAPTPRRPPTHGITGVGQYWPVAGTVPECTALNPAPAFDPEYPNWSITEQAGLSYILQSWPVGSAISPGEWWPRVVAGSWLYIPSLAAGSRLYKVLSIGPAFGAASDSCRLTLDRKPTSLALNTPTQVMVVESVNIGGAGLPCKVWGQAAGATVSGAPVLLNEWLDVRHRPFEYDATAGVLAFTVNPPQ